MAQRPRVVVTGTARRWSPSWWCTWLILHCLGAKPLRASVRHSCEQKNIDAVIIGGGDDISPSQYNQPPERDGEYDPDRDALEVDWIRWALENSKPLLGICRGSQLINVVLGGELDQNIRKLRQLTYNRPGLLPTKQVFLEPKSLLAKVCKKKKLRVNSLHSQIVKQTGVGMVAVGWDLDGFLQASEGQGEQCIIGVQWHPEYLFYVPSQIRIFRWLIKQ
ncbi:gamma-glutamyl-gamma-aminobutyrate hydrolase family protein [Idiomarina sp. HP20-50]|uniref:gamma-glutamyl-gamma-aminobutyrate hydrolase family protein n=1 Tax=Idiomarina sp. HP20-50 TaxID=3070813 RepID=UPI00294B2C89|nr:gamma-glutamyl-gamma-aminobutyrate hydrolase family protein [Idiomarina sp. HP20-50]MDV6316899.1 gamma-glutamyl-gamma-aminobutyrate hydrolase family protein [Idiomarina sp. HP20-50]